MRIPEAEQADLHSIFDRSWYRNMVMIANRVKIDEHTITVGLGELGVSADPRVSLACLGLGSCVCVCAYDQVSKIAGMAHVVLPMSKPDWPDKAATKYADIAVPVMLDRMKKAGASAAHLSVKLIGGAKLIRSVDKSDAFKIGERNLRTVRKLLAERNIPVAGEATGGHCGRSAWLFVDTGQVLVRKSGEEPREL